MLHNCIYISHTHCITLTQHFTNQTFHSISIGHLLKSPYDYHTEKTPLHIRLSSIYSASKNLGDFQGLPARFSLSLASRPTYTHIYFGIHGTSTTSNARTHSYTRHTYIVFGGLLICKSSANNNAADDEFSAEQLSHRTPADRIDTSCAPV